MDYKKICVADGVSLIFIVMLNQIILGSAKEIIINAKSGAFIYTIFICLLALAFGIIIPKLFKAFSRSKYS